MRHTFGIIGHMNTQYLLGLFVAVLVIGGLFLYTSRAPSAPVSPAEHIEAVMLAIAINP